MSVNVSVVWSLSGMLGIPNALVSAGAVKAFAELVVKASATHASMIHLILDIINISSPFSPELALTECHKVGCLTDGTILMRLRPS